MGPFQKDPEGLKNIGVEVGHSKDFLDLIRSRFETLGIKAGDPKPEADNRRILNPKPVRPFGNIVVVFEPESVVD